MKKFLLLLLFLYIFGGINSAFAYELILPKEKKMSVDTKYALFMGKATSAESITINDSRVYIAENGAFAHSVKLKNGENRIIIKSNYNTQIYKIYKKNKKTDINTELEEFDPQVFEVINDNTPFRSTPIDYGMNRMSHLFSGTKLLINGKKNGFYRVLLSKNKEGWISESSVKEAYDIIYSPQFLETNSINYKNASEHIINFSEKLPYTIEDLDDEILFKVYNPFVSDSAVYTLNIKKPEKYSYKVLLKDGCYNLKLSHFPILENNSLENLNVVIDAGHGGTELGAIGCLGDKEKDVNLKIAQELKDLLSLMGANVIMTRDCDGYISLNDRVELARDNYANLFISIHLNSIPDIEMNIHKNRGTSVYYYNNHSKEFAKIMQKNIISSLKTRDDGVKSASFAVIRPTDYIGILIEVAYMTNPIDSVLYRQNAFPKNVAKSIADGICEFVYCQNSN